MSDACKGTRCWGWTREDCEALPFGSQCCAGCTHDKRQAELAFGTETPCEELRPGAVIGGQDVVICEPYDYAKYVSVVARCTNNEVVIRSWDKGTSVLVFHGPGNGEYGTECPNWDNEKNDRCAGLMRPGARRRVPTGELGVVWACDDCGYDVVRYISSRASA